MFAEENAGKAGRTQASERNTNAAAYLCSVPALTFLWSHSHAVERTVSVDVQSDSCPLLEHINIAVFVITRTGVIAVPFVLVQSFVF